MLRKETRKMYGSEVVEMVVEVDLILMLCGFPSISGWIADKLGL